MNFNIILDYLILSAFVSLAVNYMARNIARRNELLVDLPDKSRKFHKRPTPLTGGIAIFISLLISGKIYIDLNELNDFIPLFSAMVFVASFFIITIFLIDDIKGIRPAFRLIAQSIAAYFVIYSTGIYLESLGDLFGFGEINLGVYGIPITIFCVVGVMNAFNMIDGINGLCAGSALVMLLFTGISSGFIYDSMLVLIIGSVIGFLVFNLRIVGKKRAVFLGDHGSNFIGFIVAWVAIHCSQMETYAINPITIVWFIAIPFLDCIGLIISRTLRGRSWATPGRDHIHNKLMQKFSPESSLIIIMLFSTILGLFALILENNFNEYISFYGFGLFALSYYLIFYFRYRNKLPDTLNV
jgi:UDP-GlcNAc:undecaprenyl-phosphate GlcNAc-1-phosphate transferase